MAGGAADGCRSAPAGFHMVVVDTLVPAWTAAGKRPVRCRLAVSTWLVLWAGGLVYARAGGLFLRVHAHLRPVLVARGPGVTVERKRSMRIGFDITALSVAQSGVGTYTANLYEHLSRLGVEIVPLTHYPATYRWSDNGHNGGRPRVLNKTLWMQAVLPLSIAHLDLDVCHFTNNVGPIWSPRPTVLTLHDMTLWLLPEYHTIRRIASMRPIIPLAARRAAAIITVSESAKADIVRVLGLPPEKIHVIYEAPSPRFHRLPDSAALEAVRRRYDLPERFVLHVGTLEPRKNIIRLLEAFALLRQTDRIDHQLVLVGNQGWFYGKIFAAIEQFGLRSCVQFAGYVPLDDLVAFYNLADALIFPSLYEGFGLPVIEAMACGGYSRMAICEPICDSVGWSERGGFRGSRPPAKLFRSTSRQYNLLADKKTSPITIEKVRLGDRDSNPDLWIQSPLFCPLNYPPGRGGLYPTLFRSASNVRQMNHRVQLVYVCNRIGPLNAEAV